MPKSGFQEENNKSFEGEEFIEQFWLDAFTGNLAKEEKCKLVGLARIQRV